ncbi:fibrinogen-like protein 1 isoform X2 [Drosophila grimshawi]|uniref:fibrinogen-like protein 1 isoform X2 n=1 Tax=Drosophila grimshawi TaxID=7222 RepID=UPI000C86ED62|nr:fibrinogen-like protein 1 isoform X2 [Drosophila grimshawi]
MKLYFSLFALSLIACSKGLTNCSLEKDQMCGAYCYKVVKPLLNFLELLRSKDEQLAELQTKISEQQASIVSLKESFIHTEAQLKQQIELTDDLKKKLTENAAEISKMQSEVKSKDSPLSEKDKEITHLQSQVKDKDNKLSLNDNKIKQWESKSQEILKDASCFDKATNVYTIKVPDSKTFSVSCDSQLAGTGWTVIQRRINGSVNFNRNWEEYKAGFGDLRGEFFIGLEKLHLLTQSQPHELYIYLEDFDNETRYAQYNHFVVGSEAESYSLKEIGEYSDRDNDTHPGNCANAFESGWWYLDCYYCNLNGPHASKGADFDTPIISWNKWKRQALKSTQMMIRPKHL